MEAGSELSGGTNLFWRGCPVLVPREDRGEERTTELTIRLIATGQKHGQRVLRLFLSSETDPYFLQLLEVGEEEYALLRQDQGIRVDFANFPGKLIGLLDKCIACKAEDLPRFQAVLQVGMGQGQGSLKVVENNDFKQLPHITLCLRPGSDAAIKQWLAFRLGELRGDAGQLSAELERTQSERNSLQNSLGEARHAAAEAREQRERLSMECAADAKAREAALLEAKSKEVAELREAGQRERGELEAKYRQALEAAQARAADLDAEARALREQKYGLDSRVSELSHKLGAAEGSNRSLTEEVERLRACSAALGRVKAERDVELGEALTKVAALEDKVAGQQVLAAEQAQRLRELEASLRQVEARAAELKEAAQGHEGRAAEAGQEVAKANAILEKMANDLQLQKEKVRRKAAIVARQEEELAARDKAVDEAGQRARSLQRDMERANEDAEALRREVGDMRGRLEESRAAAASNEQMIRWLNNQITETQLHYGGGAGPGLLASRYSFRPGAGASGTAMVPPIGAGSAAAGVSAGGVAPPGASVGASVPAVRLPLAPSTYRTPVVPSTSGSSTGGFAAGPSPASGGSSAVPQSGSIVGVGGMPTRGPFRSSFYATHFGSSATGGTSGSYGQVAPAAPAASTTTARSLNLSTGSLGQAGGSAGIAAPPAGAAAGAGSAPAAPAAAPVAAKPLASRFEAPTYRMTATAGGSVPVPVTSASS